MKQKTPDPLAEFDMSVRLPPWVPRAAKGGDADRVFASGACLAALHAMTQVEPLPQALLRDRLALRAATTNLRLIGRHDSETALRDAVHLLRPEDQPGPGGIVFQQWRRATSRPISVSSVTDWAPAAMQDDIAGWLKSGPGNPVAQAAELLETALRAHPKHSISALILADTVLARALEWEYTLPLLAIGLRGRDVRAEGAALVAACHMAVLAASPVVLQMASDLTRRANQLRRVAPKLRSKASAKVVDIFLSHDGVSPPVTLTRVMTDRSARRICERLMDLGAVRELTGRDTFRLYGL